MSHTGRMIWDEYIDESLYDKAEMKQTIEIYVLDEQAVTGEKS